VDKTKISDPGFFGHPNTCLSLDSRHPPNLARWQGVAWLARGYVALEIQSDDLHEESVALGIPRRVSSLLVGQ
jgi:hypothetical protein